MTTNNNRFYWGCSTASHQIEGNTINDWSAWEKTNAARLAQDAPKNFSNTPRWEEVKAEATNPTNYISGICDDSYNKWQEDIALLKTIGVNAYRFSIEWSRIEPAEGQFNGEALAHYKTIINTLLENKIEPFVTIVHRTIPQWVASQGGWANKKTVENYIEYTKQLVATLGASVTYWMPLNEPVLNVTGGFFGGVIPPNRINPLAGFAAYHNMITAHNQAYSIIHEANPMAQVGPAQAAVYAEAEGGHWYNQILVNGVHWFMNWKFLDGIKNYTDFIGIQYYTRGVIGWRKSKFLIPLPGEIPQPGPASDMGQEIYPQGLYKYTQLVWKRYRKPIIVTENGIADRDDTLRPQYITNHVAEVQKLQRDGVDMRGYFYWSLLDNFEWDKGFWPEFGLAQVDRTTQNRSLRPSAQTYKKIIAANTIGE